MLSRLKKVLGMSHSAPTEGEPPPLESRARDVVRVPRENGEQWQGGDEFSDDYFPSMAAMQEAISKRDYQRAAEFVHKNLTHIREFVQRTSAEYGSFHIPSIPALERGGTILALMGDRKGLESMLHLVKSVPALQERTADIEAHLTDLDLFEAITEAVRTKPGCLQTDVKGIVRASDGRRVSTLIGWLEKAGRIRRTKEGRTYALTLRDTATEAPVLPRRAPRSQRTSGEPVRVREIDLASLPYVSLPRAPLRWEERESRRVPEPVPEPSDSFELADASGWTLRSVEKIPMEQRPDTAYRRFFSSLDGLFLVDDLGKTDAFPDAPASVLRYDHRGNEVASAPLLHDIYRISVNPLGRGFAALSRGAVLHAYDDALRPFLETGLSDYPEVRALQSRMGLGSELRSYLRAVALSHDTSRYLVTAVDEAWCFSRGGEALWGRKLPLKEGWREVAQPAGEAGTSEEIQEALRLMELRLPISANEIKQRYRDLAKSWHPDLNPGDTAAGERMQALNHAAEILTGVNSTALPRYTGSRFQNVVDTLTVEDEGVGIQISIGMEAGPLYAADWIYAAAFAGRSGGVFLAGYSGRIVQLDESGEAVRAYDIGVVPRAIADTLDYLYFMTDTRLYVLRGEELHAIVDTFDGGELVIGQTGFALIEKKRLRWFREDGEYLGSVITKAPIRRAYHDGSALVVETRQQRAAVEGAPHWWE